MQTEAPTGTLRLAPGVRELVVRSSLDARPREACGLLVGSPGSGAVVASTATRARNLRGETTSRFELDPGHLVATEDAARAEGLEIVGVWHSHPESPAEPSEDDRRGAWGGWLHLIVSLAGGEVDLRAWRLEGERFAEIAVGLEEVDG